MSLRSFRGYALASTYTRFIDLATSFTYIRFTHCVIFLVRCTCMRASRTRASLRFGLTHVLFIAAINQLARALEKRCFSIQYSSPYKNLIVLRFSYSHDEQMHKKNKAMHSAKTSNSVLEQTRKTAGKAAERKRNGYLSPTRSETFPVEGMLHLVDWIPIIHSWFSELHVEFRQTSGRGGSAAIGSGIARCP
jgi:hypothetical protein